MSWTPPLPHAPHPGATQPKFEARYPCPCCGHLTFKKIPGSGVGCEICYWIDDARQLRWPRLGEGKNFISLVQAQENYARYGSCEERFSKVIRQARPDEPIEYGFRPINLQYDRFEDPRTTAHAPWPPDPTFLYWWRPSFWIANVHPGHLAPPPPQ
ncbi:MAG: hypothetical protein HKL80_00440, partial [Acidimicrobiales bacterium]|nr:hypothetical protein [Acidimicrobiales bacterium]